MKSEDPEPAPTPGTPSRTGSPGYQTGSEEPATFSEAPEPESSEDESVDPYEAFARAASKGRSKREKRDPGLWLPGSDDLDKEEALADAETRFSRDAWGGRGNPQVSIRLRPRDFERLGQAADLYGVRRTTLARMMVIRGITAILDSELRREGEFLRERLRP
jgi:hypothetical protein